MASANALWESIDTGGSRRAGLAASDDNTLRRYRLSLAYLYKKEFGFGAGYTHTSGSSDAVFFRSPRGRPDTGEIRLEVYWNALFGRVPKSYPWVRTRIGLQYVHFTELNGASSDVDGAGRDASDNDTVIGYWVLVF
jgi:hypothetical protein